MASSTQLSVGQILRYPCRSHRNWITVSPAHAGQPAELPEKIDEHLGVASLGHATRHPSHQVTLHHLECPGDMARLHFGRQQPQQDRGNESRLHGVPAVGKLRPHAIQFVDIQRSTGETDVRDIGCGAFNRAMVALVFRCQPNHHPNAQQESTTVAESKAGSTDSSVASRGRACRDSSQFTQTGLEIAFSPSACTRSR